jgi:hypothetical protein
VLLTAAFGPNYQEKLSGFTAGRLTGEIRAGASRLTEHLAKIAPESSHLEVVVTQIPTTDTIELLVSLRDSFNSETMLELRGNGMRKIVTLLAHLVQAQAASRNRLIMLDEPENSLHADAQHFLRRFLVEIAQDESNQVLYATHSPSMISRIDTYGLRLFEQCTVDGRPSISINNKPYGDNLSSIRASLGLTATDSLLYAPISVIVEGPTEIVSLSYLLQRLSSEDVAGFEDIDTLLDLTHLINGQGDNFPLLCRIAKSQGSTPILFVDGDKARRLEQKRFKQEHSEVPVVTLDKGTEFEDLVPAHYYFAAIGDWIGDSFDEEEAQNEFKEWESSNELPEQMLFSKRVTKWLTVSRNIDLDKPLIMRKAIELAPVDEINLTPITMLLATIRKLVGGT